MDKRPAGGSNRPSKYALPLLFSFSIATFAMVWLLYREMLAAWWGLYVEPGSYYAHAAFVPFFVAVMIYRNREKLEAAKWSPSWAGLALILPAMGLLMLAKHADVTVVKSLSFIMLLVGSVLMLSGPSKTRVLLFPILFILTMVPLFPDQLINVIAFPIQLASTKIATFLLNVFMLHAERQGTMIQMDSYKMAVEGACSGFKTLVSLLTFSAAFAYLVEAAPWKRWTLFLVTAPLSLLINGLRIFFIGGVGELISTKAAATFHDWSGFIVLIMAFLFLFNFARLLRCERFLGIPLDDSELGKEEAKDADAPQVIPWWQSILDWRPSGYLMRRSTPYLLALDIVLLGGVSVQHHFMQKTLPEAPIGTQDVPMQLTSNGVTWTAMHNTMMDRLTKDIQDQLHPTRVVSRYYDGTDGGHVEFFMTAGNGRWTFHDPHNCSLGSDATLQDVGVITIPTSKGTVPLRLLESRYKRLGHPEETEMMFCYVSEGQVLQRTEQMHKSLVVQTFFGDSGKPSYFLRFTQTQPGTDEEKRQQLIRFIGAMWEQISPILTGKVKAHVEPPPTPEVTEHGSL